MRKKRRFQRRGLFRLILTIALAAALYFVINSFIMDGAGTPGAADTAGGGSALVDGEGEAGSDGSGAAPGGEDAAEPEPEPIPATVTVTAVDADSGLPIKGAEYEIVDNGTGASAGVIVTGSGGRGVSGPLEAGRDYTVRLTGMPVPYRAGGDSEVFTAAEGHQELVTEHRLPEHVKDVTHTADGDIEIGEVYIPVETVIQLPELPNGCEITSLTSVLRTYGYDVTKEEMADTYLPKVAFYRVDGVLYGANPYKAYAGDPRDARGGFFVYAPPIIEAAEAYFHHVGVEHVMHDISGSTHEEILAYLDQGVPVVIWVTLDLSEKRMNYSWYFHDTGEHFPAPVNLHNVVLHGYKGDEVYVMDPLQGLVVHDMEAFFASYDDLGEHALVVMPGDA